MNIESIRIENYRCFNKTQDISFSPNFNVIVGKNNSGKTALLQTLSLNFSDNPHQSLNTKGKANSSIIQTSNVQLGIRINQSELKKFVMKNNKEFYVAQPMIPGNEQIVEDFIKDLFSSDNINICGKYSSGRLVESSFTNAPYEGGDSNIKFEVNQNNEPIKIGSNHHGNNKLSKQLMDRFVKNIIYIKDERNKIGEHEFGLDIVLKPDFSNLPIVIHNLIASNKAKFNRYLQIINDIFPDIKEITAPTSGKTNVQVKIWNIDRSTERDDLAIPLRKSGKGIFQILALIFLVFSTESPHVILIDEPQSSIHPGGIRKLFSILRQKYSHHQYIVSTHSPVVISAINPEKIIRLEKSGMESQIYSVDTHDSEEMEKVLSSVGARLSDVFGADDILWVEGPTEENCFPLIVNKILDKPLLGTVILGLINTGDLEGKESRRAFKIYEKLSKGQSLIPPAIGFLLDREGKNGDERKDIKKRSDGKAKFINRRMYENYLINPKAIAYVINATNLKYSEKEVKEITAKEIESWIENNGGEDTYKSKYSGNNLTNNDEWLETVHGANLLKDIFKQFTESVPYDKKEHGLELTKWIIENSPEDLDEIASQLDDFLQK